VRTKEETELIEASRVTNESEMSQGLAKNKSVLKKAIDTYSSGGLEVLIESEPEPVLAPPG